MPITEALNFLAVKAIVNGDDRIVTIFSRTHSNPPSSRHIVKTLRTAYTSGEIRVRAAFNMSHSLPRNAQSWDSSSKVKSPSDPPIAGL
jgi:hypothetical protein